MANKLAALDALSKAVPGLNEEAAKRAQAATQTQLQAQLGAAPRQLNVTQAAQQTAPQVVAQQGQIAQQAQAQTQQTLQQVGNQALQQKAFDDQQSLATAETAQRADLAGQEQRQGLTLQREQIASKKTQTARDIQSQKTLQRFGIDVDSRLQMATLKQREDLSRLGNDLEGKLLTSRLAFERDEQGRKFSNERQLADWAVANAKTEIEFRDRLQAMEQESQKKTKLMEISLQGIQDTLERGYIEKRGDLDFEHQKKLLQIQKALQEKIQRDANAAKNRMSVFSAAGTIAGAGLGFMAGGPAGAMLGASAGQGVGTMAAGATA